MWHHPWQLVHRIALHDRLKETATGEDGPGTPAVLRTASKVVDVDAEAGVVTLEGGSSVVADVIIGADGVYVSDFCLKNRLQHGFIRTDRFHYFSLGPEESSMANNHACSVQEKQRFGSSSKERWH
jgi:hypothetical protein